MRCIALGLMMAGAAALHASTLDEAKEKTQSAVRAFMAENPVPAVAVAVAVNGNVIHDEAFGVVTPGSDTPATRETRFALGTLTQTFTTALVARLAEQRVLDWDAPAERYVTEFSYYGKGLTLKRIASHLSGIGDAFATRNAGTMHHFANAKEALPYITASALEAEPGEATHISIGAYTVLGAAIERATKEDYFTALNQHVLEPLALKSIAVLDPREPLENFAVLHDPSDGDALPAAPYDPSLQLAGAGLIGTAGDVARFVSSLNRGGFLRETSVRQLFTAQPNKKGVKTQFGLGWAIGQKSGFDRNWIIGPDQGSRDIAHQPGLGIGISHWAVLDRRTGLAVVVLTNLTAAPVGGNFFDEILDAFLAAEAEVRALQR